MVKKDVEYSQEEAKLSALLDAVKVKREKYNQTELKSVKYEFVSNKKNGQMNIKINCIENIAEEVEIQTE